MTIKNEIEYIEKILADDRCFKPYQEDSKEEYKKRLQWLKIERRRRIIDKIENIIIWSIIGAAGAMLGLIFVGEYLLRV